GMVCETTMKVGLGRASSAASGQRRLGDMAGLLRGQPGEISHQAVQVGGLLVHGIGTHQFAVPHQGAIPGMVGYDEHALVGTPVLAMLYHASACAFPQEQVDQRNIPPPVMAVKPVDGLFFCFRDTHDFCPGLCLQDMRQVRALGRAVFNQKHL
ncbi:MAG: hypothetical protein MUP33_13160, partial [Polaromonas sp.]|nr:hypothetical protein [Polaromonas sp.]